MENKQQYQEEWMHLQQMIQRDMIERMREQQERGRLAAEEARRTARLPKSMLQNFKFSILQLNRSGRRRHGLCSLLGSLG